MTSKFRSLIVVLAFFGCAFHVVWCEEAELETVFDPNDEQQGYQRRYIIEVTNKKEDCFFVENVQAGQIFNFHFMVRSGCRGF